MADDQILDLDEFFTYRSPGSLLGPDATNKEEEDLVWLQQKPAGDTNLRRQPVGPTATTRMEVNHWLGGPYQPVPLPHHHVPTIAAAAEFVHHHQPPSTFFTSAAGTEEMLLQSGTALPAANAGHAHLQPDPYPPPYSTGHTSCSASAPTAAAADTGSSSLDQEANAGAGLPHPGGGGGGERKKRVRGPPTPELSSVELEAGLIQSDPSSTDIKPPVGSTPRQIIQFLRRESNPNFSKQSYWLNVGLAYDDQTAPKAIRRYVTTVEMKADKMTDQGFWKEKQVQSVKEHDCLVGSCAGFKKTFQFHRHDGTKTNLFMDEYIPLERWGAIDLYMERLRFREVYEGAEVPAAGESTSRKVAAVKHRMRGPENLVIEGDSAAWKHFIKVYDRHPELEGSKLVYAVCFHCDRVLNAPIKNGTNNLSTHCDRTCPVKNKNQQQATS